MKKSRPHFLRWIGALFATVLITPLLNCFVGIIFFYGATNYSSKIFAPLFTFIASSYYVGAPLAIIGTAILFLLIYFFYNWFTQQVPPVWGLIGALIGFPLPIIFFHEDLITKGFNPFIVTVGIFPGFIGGLIVYKFLKAKPTVN